MPTGSSILHHAGILLCPSGSKGRQGRRAEPVWEACMGWAGDRLPCRIRWAPGSMSYISAQNLTPFVIRDLGWRKDNSSPLWSHRQPLWRRQPSRLHTEPNSLSLPSTNLLRAQCLWTSPGVPSPVLPPPSGLLAFAAASTRLPSRGLSASASQIRRPWRGTRAAPSS